MHKHNNAPLLNFMLFLRIGIYPAIQLFGPITMRDYLSYWRELSGNEVQKNHKSQQSTQTNKQKKIIHIEKIDNNKLHTTEIKAYEKRKRKANKNKTRINK